MLRSTRSSIWQTTVASFLGFVFLLASAGAIENPTGSCSDPVEAATARAAPDENVYLKDCKLDFLNKEYWKVYARSDTEFSTAFISPRPDGKPEKYGLCDPDTNPAEVIAMFQKYQLCQGAVTDSEIVNNMDPAEALQITHMLHENLQFEFIVFGDVGGASISPYANDGDTLAACDMLADKDPNHAAASYCSAVRNRCDEDGICADIGIIPSKAQAEALVPALNQLYGIIPSPASSESEDPSSSTIRSLSLALVIAAFFFPLIGI